MILPAAMQAHRVQQEHPGQEIRRFPASGASQRRNLDLFWLGWRRFSLAIGRPALTQTARAFSLMIVESAFHP